MGHGHDGLSIGDLFIVVLLEHDLLFVSPSTVHKPETGHNGDNQDDDTQTDKDVLPSRGMDDVVCGFSTLSIILTVIRQAFLVTATGSSKSLGFVADQFSSITIMSIRTVVSRNDKGVSRAIVFVCSVDGIVVDTSLTDSDIGVVASIIKTDAAVTIKVAIELFPVGRRLTLVISVLLTAASYRYLVQTVITFIRAEFSRRTKWWQLIERIVIVSKRISILSTSLPCTCPIIRAIR